MHVCIFQLAIACLIVDPASNSVIAEATDLRHHHPLQHAVMVCIDEVARQQEGGAWVHSGQSAVRF